MKRAAVLVVLGLALTGCGGGEASEAPDVAWGDRYSNAVKSKIDAAAEAQDCDALQREFDTAYANDETVRARTGEGTVDLLDYVQYRIDQAGC